MKLNIKIQDIKEKQRIIEVVDMWMVQLLKKWSCFQSKVLCVLRSLQLCRCFGCK